MLDAISFLFSASVTIFHALNHVQEKDQDKRDAAEQYLRQIAQTIQEIIQEHEQGKVPHGKCAQLRGFTDRAPEVLRGVVHGPTIDLFVTQLREASDVERFLIFLQGEKLDLVYKLKVAQWNFSTAADKLLFKA